MRSNTEFCINLHFSCRKDMKKEMLYSMFSRQYILETLRYCNKEWKPQRTEFILILNLGRNYKYLCAFKTNDLMIYIVLGHQRITTNGLSFSSLSLQMDLCMSHGTTGKDNDIWCMLFTLQLSIYTTYTFVIFTLFLFSYLSLSMQYLCIHIISLKRISM